MDGDEIWNLAGKPVTEFVESIAEMRTNVDKLIKFYLEHCRDESSDLPMVIDGQNCKLARSHGERQSLSPLAKAKLELSIVFALNTCYWLYLVTEGEDPSKNTIYKDVERIKLFMNRAKEVEILLSGVCSSTKKLKTTEQARDGG